jgi:methionyl-tRNA synthetase
MPILYNLFNSIYALSAMLEVVLPNKIREIGKIFNLSNFEFAKIEDKNKLDNFKLNISDFSILFPRFK